MSLQEVIHHQIINIYTTYVDTAAHIFFFTFISQPVFSGLGPSFPFRTVLMLQCAPNFWLGSFLFLFQHANSPLIKYGTIMFQVLKCLTSHSFLYYKNGPAQKTKIKNISFALQCTATQNSLAIPFQCGVRIFLPCLCESLPGASASSYSLKTCRLIGQLDQDVLQLLPIVSWDWLQPSTSLQRMVVIMDV